MQLINRKLAGLVQLYSEGSWKTALRKRWNFKGDYDFINRSRSKNKLIIIVAGYKQQLWEMIFPRFKKYFNSEYDVCIVVPGKKNKQLASIAELNGWSLLETKDNKIALGQNLAILLHGQADIICKLDEDIFIGNGFLEGLEEALLKTEIDGRHKVGFVAPVMNVNGFTIHKFLERIGKSKDFQDKFGIVPYSCVDTPVWSNVSIAEYLWVNTHPFDKITELFFSDPYSILICHHRFSIGAILFRRKQWELMNGFTVSLPGVLGMEEIDLCAWCNKNSQAMVIASRVFAGHAGFSGQINAIEKILKDRNDIKV